MKKKRKDKFYHIIKKQKTLEDYSIQTISFIIEKKKILWCAQFFIYTKKYLYKRKDFF